MKWWIGLIVCALAFVTGCDEPCEPAPGAGSLGSPTRWEQEYLEAGARPQPPERASVIAEDGLPLSYTQWVPDEWTGDGAIVVFVHGSSAYGDLYATLGQALSTRGVLARVIDVRGHGYSVCTMDGVCGVPDLLDAPSDDGRYWVGRPGDALDVNQHARDLHVHISELRAQWPAATLTLAGHSSGGGLVSRYAEQVGSASIDQFALLAPFNHPNQPQNDLQSWECGAVTGTAYARVDMGAFGDARRGNTHRYVLEFHKDAEYLTPIDTTKYTYTTMLGMAAVDPELFHDTLRAPTLWFAAAEDALLDLERSRSEYAKLPEGVGFVVVEDTSHVGVSWSTAVGEHLAEFARGAARGDTNLEGSGQAR